MINSVFRNSNALEQLALVKSMNFGIEYQSLGLGKFVPMYFMVRFGSVKIDVVSDNIEQFNGAAAKAYYNKAENKPKWLLDFVKFGSKTNYVEFMNNSCVPYFVIPILFKIFKVVNFKNLSTNDIVIMKDLKLDCYFDNIVNYVGFAVRIKGIDGELEMNACVKLCNSVNNKMSKFEDLNKTLRLLNDLRVCHCNTYLCETLADSPVKDILIKLKYLIDNRKPQFSFNECTKNIPLSVMFENSTSSICREPLVKMNGVKSIDDCIGYLNDEGYCPCNHLGKEATLTPKIAVAFRLRKLLLRQGFNFSAITGCPRAKTISMSGTSF
jgi:hypothetical protein